MRRLAGRHPFWSLATTAGLEPRSRKIGHSGRYGNRATGCYIARIDGPTKITMIASQARNTTAPAMRAMPTRPSAPRDLLPPEPRRANTPPNVSKATIATKPINVVIFCPTIADLRRHRSFRSIHRFTDPQIRRQLRPPRPSARPAPGTRCAQSGLRISTGRPAARHSGKPSASRRATSPCLRRTAMASKESTHQGPRQ
jgi:hypothetical protein